MMETWAIIVLVLGLSVVSASLTFLLMKRRASHSDRRFEKEFERAREAKEIKPEVVELDDKERAKLELEYKECSQDWRLRDKYVLDKLSAAGILFMLLGVALGTIPPTAWGVKIGLLVIGALFSFILSISVAKDTYFPDGSEKLLGRLSAQLGIYSSLQILKSLEGFDDGLNFEELQFPRKIRIQRDKYSIPLPNWLNWWGNWLLDRGTFR